jgi:hypothetical protein
MYKKDEAFSLNITTEEVDLSQNLQHWNLEQFPIKH